MIVGGAFVPDRGTDRGRHVLPAFDAVQRVVRLHGHDAHALRPERRGDADDRPGRSDPRDEVRHPTSRLLPDLWARPELMSERVRRIGVLVDVHIALPLGGGHTLRLADRAVGPLERIGEHELGAERADDAFALDRDLVRHAELEGVTAHRADHRQCDSGVPAGRVEDRSATAQASGLFGGKDHPEPRTVFDAAARVDALDLRPELAAKASADAMQRDERGAADSLEDRAAHALPHELRCESGHGKRLKERARQTRTVSSARRASRSASSGSPLASAARDQRSKITRSSWGARSSASWRASWKDRRAAAPLPFIRSSPISTIARTCASSWSTFRANLSADWASSSAASGSLFANTSACDALIEARVESRLASAANRSARTKHSRARVVLPCST